MAPPESYYNRKVRKKFGSEWYEGIVDRHEVEDGEIFIHVTYSDGDEEEYSEEELLPLLKAAEKAGLRDDTSRGNGKKGGGKKQGGAEFGDGDGDAVGDGNGDGDGVGGRRKRARPAAGAYRDPGVNEIGDTSPPKKKQRKKNAAAAAKTPPPSFRKKQNQQSATTSPKSSAKKSNKSSSSPPGGGSAAARRFKSPSKLGALPKLQPVSIGPVS